jgi:uncharacterized protein YaaN involved in tellurite resistance
MTSGLPIARPGEHELQLGVDVDALKRDLGAGQGGAGPTADAEIEARASEHAARLLALVMDDAPGADDVRDTVDSLGQELQLRATNRSRMLLEPVKELAGRGADGGSVAAALTNLRMQVEALDPNRVDLDAGWPVRLAGMIPGLGNPLKRYFTKYQSAQVVIDEIIRSLEIGRDQLRRDNATLADDQREMQAVGHELRAEIAFAQALDRRLDALVTERLIDSSERARFVQEELQFPVRQRTLDLQQQLAVGQQGILASEIVIRNNRELIRGVDRSITVTVTALRTAVSVAFALAHQRIVLDKVAAVGQTTSNLIASTAERLRTQGAEIQARSADAALDMEQLRAAFADINLALDEISTFRREALPRMAQAIVEFDQLTSAAEENIARLGVESAPPATEG